MKIKENKKKIIVFGIIGIVLMSVVLVTMFSWTWNDISDPNCYVESPAFYKDKANTFKLVDKSNEGVASLEINFRHIEVGTLIFYIYTSMVEDFTVDFYQDGLMVVSLDNIIEIIKISNWYLFKVDFNCLTDSGKVYIDGIYEVGGEFQKESEYFNKIVVSTDIVGFNDLYFNLVSII